jgi:hypothetical protein
MKHKRSRGGANIELAFVYMVLIPLFLGTAAAGINMTRVMSTIQLARDAGHMYARGLDFSQPGNQTVLVQLGGSLGLSTNTSTSAALVILSAITYVDAATCSSQGYTTATCPNYQQWVFTQRLTIGNTSLHVSGFGSPVTGGAQGVTIASNGTITPAQYVAKTGARAKLLDILNYQVVAGVVEGLPSGQMVYVAEAAGTGFSMYPFFNNPATYSYGLF